MPTRSEPDSSVLAAPAQRYERIRSLGRGAWGVVYLARDTVIGREVALKEIPFDPSLGRAERRDLGARSIQEARAAGGLNHPGVVTIHDAGLSTDGNSFFIVMEYVNGRSLRERLASGPLPPGEAARLGGQIASALDAAHRAGIVHRDVKPANILMTGDGAAKIADFGIAKVESSDLTRSGETLGSPAYMAPEQILGRPLDSRCDIYATGVVLYQMVTGRAPFLGKTPTGVCYQIVHTTPPKPSELNPALEGAWDRCILRAMAKHPEERHGSAAELAEELAKLAGTATAGAAGTGAARTTVALATGGTPDRTLVLVDDTGSPPAEGGRRSRRRVIGLAAAAAALILGIGLTGMALMVSPPPDATLRLEVLHRIRNGEVILDVDGATIWRQTIAAVGREKKSRAFVRKIARRPEGRAVAEVSVPSGARTFTVTVIDNAGGDPWSSTSRHRLEPESENTLRVKVLAGMTRGLELDWR